MATASDSYSGTSVVPLVLAHTVASLQGHKSTREVHFANWIVPLLSASNDSPVIATPASFIPKSFAAAVHFQNMRFGEPTADQNFSPHFCKQAH